MKINDKITIYNGDCLKVLDELIEKDIKVDTIFYIILFLLFLPFLIEIKKYYTKMLRELKELGGKNEKKTFK